ncbi:hypothetical protein A1O1_08736 [Capronia coronata CBS 617.96]|uniref:Translation initiation factor 3 C-terminal domain-containing protein n=1 Tax=Capronia coronata CBS 617.96 TaxID=1182541 RepID=W9XG48_9EURO|nr:uncharacterized protein A1O1_08736 [Capronia coronata CBS 617.96]EXJ79472.1 hypothetical protein A1O1_08736 [Capronia coronata CBS 617.96]
MQRLSVLLRPLLRATAPAGKPAISRFQARHFGTSPSYFAADHRRGAGKLQIVTIDDKLAQFPLDEKIDTHQVRVKTPDGKISSPVDLRRVLNSLDRTTSHVLQLSKPGEHDLAIVQVVQRSDLIKQIKDKEAAQRRVQHAQKEKRPKQIEVNWAISNNDLQLKLKQMEDFLRKGKKVEILLASKRRQRKASTEEAETLLKTLKEKIQEVGAVEIAPMEGALLRQATMSVKMP